MSDYLPVVIAAVIGGGISLLFRLPGAVVAWWGAREKAQHEQKELIFMLKRELYPNGGSSLRDKVNECAADSKKALSLAEESTAIAREVRTQVQAHVTWHLGDA